MGKKFLRMIIIKSVSRLSLIHIYGCLGTLTNLSYMIDANGNISVAISGTNDPDGKIAKENAERKAKKDLKEK